MSIEEVIENFNKHFTGAPRVFTAPGRVNLIGEHTDYNDGFVLPMAIDRYTTVAVSPRTDRKLVIWSENMFDERTVSLEDELQRKNHWSDYVVGVAVKLEEAGVHIPGANLYIESKVPVGSGLSSSAAIEMASALALLSTANQQLEPTELAKLGQRAENEFVGMNCGIMDQFISMHGKEDHALFLDCRTLDYELVPLPSDQTRIVVCNTMVKHELGASEYNTRRAECEQGVELLQKYYPDVDALRDVSLEQFLKVQEKLPEPVRQRCRHVISEDERVLESVTALKLNDLARFGDLMNQSHESLRDDYEVSCDELDLMVDIARSMPGVYGARMTGGGFGGCTVNLVEIDRVDEFCENVTMQYKEKTGIDPAIYVSLPSEGAHEVI